MKPIQVYTTTHCPYCVRAKQLLDKKGVAYTEINVTGDEAGRMALVEKSGGRKTVPQIFIGETHVGGNEDLYELERRGGLDPLLMAT